MHRKREMVDEQWNSLQDLMKLNSKRSYECELGQYRGYQSWNNLGENRQKRKRIVKEIDFETVER